MRLRVTQANLNSLANLPFEKWPERGVSLRAVSSSIRQVNSGILADGRYFYRVRGKSGTPDTFILEGKR